jgi:hypothetical protein
LSAPALLDLQDDERAAIERAIELLAAVPDVAAHLRFLAKEIRSAGDVGFVRLDDDGVAPDLGLADQLELQAICLVGIFKSEAT